MMEENPPAGGKKQMDMIGVSCPKRVLSWKDFKQLREPDETQCQKRLREIKKSLNGSWVNKIKSIRNKITSIKLPRVSEIIGLMKSLPALLTKLWNGRVFDKIQIFLKDHFHLVFKSAAENHLRIQKIKSKVEKAKPSSEGLAFGSRGCVGDQCNLQFDSYSHLKRYQKKVRIVTFSFSSTLASIMIVSMLIQFFPFNASQAASYSFDQQSWAGGASATNAVHPGDKTGWNKYSSATNVDFSTPTTPKMATTTPTNFPETFTSNTYNDTANTNANWNTGSGQVQMASELAGTDLYSKLNGVLGNDEISKQIMVGDDIYIGTNRGRFARYNIPTDTAYSLTSKISSFWSNINIYDLIFDSTNNVIYLGGGSGNSYRRFARYNLPSYSGGGTYPAADTAYDLAAKISSFWGSYQINSLVFDSTNNVMYLGGNSGKFARYNTTAYTAGGTYPAADTAYDLAAKISSFWSTYHINSLVFDSTNNVIYLGGGGKFARYNTTAYTAGGTYPTADTAYDLTSKISSFWSTNTVYSLAFDSTNNVVYLGGSGTSGGFARYNTISYMAGGDYSAADTAYNLTSKISFFNSEIFTLVFDSSANAIYLNSWNRFARYNTTSYIGGGAYPAADTAYNLSSKITSFWNTNNVGIKSLVFNPVDSVVYLGSYGTKFARYNTTAYTAGGAYPTVDTAYDLSSKVAGIFGGEITSLSAYGGEVYAGSYSGRFAKYNAQTGVVTDLTSKISSFWSTNGIKEIILDSTNNVIYLGGANGKFARYNTTTYAGSVTYPNADTAYDLTTKISSFWSTNEIHSLILDSSGNTIYLGGYNGRFARYNTTTYTAGGTYPTADTAYDLTAKISAFWGTNPIYSLTLDSVGKIIYLAGGSYPTNRFALYNSVDYVGGGTYPAADTAYDLVSKIPPGLANGIPSSAYDPIGKIVYLVGGTGGSTTFIRYNTAAYSAGGTYPAADTAYNLTAKISAFFYSATESVWDANNNILYIGGHNNSANGTFVKYNSQTDAVTNLRSSPDVFPFFNFSSIYAIALDSLRNKLYVSNYTGNFAEKPLLGLTSSAYSLTTDNVAYNIYYATLTKTDSVGTGTITYELSNNGGTTWESVTPATLHTFSTTGSDLRFRITVSGNATVQDVNLNYYSYNTQGELISSKYDTTDATNVVTKMEWTENLPANTDIKFQLRTSPDDSTWTSWLGPDGTNATYFTDPTGGEIMPAAFSTNTDDRYFQYRTVLESDGKYTPTLSRAIATYVVNATPSFDATFGTNGVTIDQISDSNNPNWAKVRIDYAIKDPDATTGSFTPNYVTPTFKYTLNGTDYIDIDLANITFAAAPTGGDITDRNADGKLDNKVEETNYLTYTAYWNAKTQIPESHSDTFKIKVAVSDNEAANSTTTAVGNTISLDTKNPANLSFTIDHSSNQLTLTTPTDDSSYQMYVSNYSDFRDSTPIAFSSPYTYNAITTDPATVYVRIKDQFNNYTDSSTITPAKPQNLKFFDTSNPAQSIFQEFLVWDVVPLGQTGSGFASYKIYRKTDSGSFQLIKTITDREFNYFLDPNLSGSSEYTYKLTTQDTSGNISNYSSSVIDIPNGTGSSDTSAPTIDNVSISNIETTSAKITWTTEEVSDSSVGYSTDTTYLPERGIGSLTNNHEVTITGLTPGTTYNIRVKSRDIIGNLGQNDKDNPGLNSIDAFTFATKAGPAISQITVPDISNTQATIVWKTNTRSSTYVGYATSLDVDGNMVSPVEVGTPDLVTGSSPYSHSQTLTNLVPDTTYYFYVKSVDAQSNIALDNNGGNFYEILTTEDLDPPIISGIDEPIISNNQAAIYWLTDEPASSKVRYSDAAGGPYSDTTEIIEMNRSHYVILSSLTADKKYYYKVVSKDINGNETTSDENNFTTTKDPSLDHPPISSIDGIEVPTKNLSDKNAIVTFTTDQLALCMLELTTSSGSYSNPINAFENGYAAEINYNKSHAIRLIDLIPATVYYFKLSCHDNIITDNTKTGNDKFDNWVFSTENTFTTLAEMLTSAGWGAQADAVAPKISNVKVASVTGESATITWDTDENGNSSIRYGFDSNYGNMAGDDLVNSDSENYAKSHSVVIHNLIPGTKYLFTVMSNDAAGNIGESSQSTFTTSSPSSLSSIKVESKNIGEAIVSWTTNKKLTSVVEYGLTTSYGNRKENTEYIQDHSIALSKLDQGVTYHYRVKGEDQDKNLYASADNTFEPKSPPQITGININDVTENGATITFQTNVPTDANITYTDVQNAEDTGSQGLTKLVTDHKVTLTNLKQGTTYAIMISAKDEQGTNSETKGPDLTTGKDENPPKIDNIRTESALTQNDKVQSIISWKTDEQAKSVLIFKEGRNGKEIEFKLSDNLTTNHVAVITIFKSGTVYNFKVKSTDASGNTATSDNFSLLTPRRKENVIQIIIGNFQDLFGWMKR